MSQLTLYLDEDTQKLLEQSAAAHGMSRSRWVVELIRKHSAQTWPPESLALAGAFPDFPLYEPQNPSLEDLPPDSARIGF